MHETSVINRKHIALNCFMGRERGTHSTSAQCSGKQLTRGNTKRCDSGASTLLLRRRRKALDLCRLVAAQTSLCGIKKTRTHRANHREMSHCSEKILVSRNELREIENIGATDLDRLIANFLLKVREFLFLICVKKTISMKILVLRAINGSRHRNCFVRGCIHSLLVSKTLTRSYLARSGFHTNNS